MFPGAVSFLLSKAEQNILYFVILPLVFRCAPFFCQSFCTETHQRYQYELVYRDDLYGWQTPTI